MRKIRVELGDRSYNVVIDHTILGDIGTTLEKFEFSRRLAVVSNPTVYGLYGAIVSRSIKDGGFDLTEIILPDGEKYKDLPTVQKIYDGLLKTKLDRRSAIIALGGGVIGDIAGFAASTYMRGIDFIQIPTTLLAQVDSSVGGKTGVNHELGKNMIGTFWQPRLVWVDIITLSTLPRREFLSGLAEVIKYGVIWDEELFNFLESKREAILELDQDSLKYIIGRSCEIKAEVVSKDERESGLRAILNYGHTIGHALETVTGYGKYLHGEAVAVGMHVEARLSQMLGFIDDAGVGRIMRLIESYGLPFEMPAGTDFNDFLSSVQIDKKAVSGELKFILPEKIGAVKIQSGVSPEEIKKVIKGGI
jgi:3-dehydroquinate synthase